jgi:hypothetical protein
VVRIDEDGGEKRIEDRKEKGKESFLPHLLVPYQIASAALPSPVFSISQVCVCVCACVCACLCESFLCVRVQDMVDWCDQQGWNSLSV